MENYQEPIESKIPQVGKKITSVIVEVTIIILIVVMAFSLYIVDQTEQAVVTQFGKPVRIILNPIEGRLQDKRVQQLKEKYEAEGITVSEGAGLRLKIPFIQNVQPFERRLLRWNGYPEQIPTKDKKYIWVDCTARWYIEDPLQFLRSVGTEEQAHARLDDIIDATTRNSITRRDLIEVVRTDNRQMQVAEKELQETIKVVQVTEGRPKIVAEITGASRKSCEEYGIGIHESGVLIKGLTYVQGVKEKIEDRMIEGDMERDVKTILSEAYKNAREIEGVADAKATQIYADGFNKDPDFYEFWRLLELYETYLSGEKTRLILGTDNPLLRLIKGDISQKSQSE
ncbi:MAG: protease modulator HflC [Planctomycetota bacterium]|jgi:membrane protease subunit HflC